MIERHQDYVLRGISVPANGSANFVIPIDVDAPFALRCVLSSGMPTSRSISGQTIALFQFTITGLDDRKYFGGNGTPINGFDSWLNNAPLPSPVYPQIIFPTQITIQVTVYDLSGGGISDAVLVFRGTKLYNEGSVFGPQYPTSFSELNFRYAYSITIPENSTLTNQPLDVLSDADFVVRMCSAGNLTGDVYDPENTWVTLRDQYGKPYSSGVNITTGLSSPWVPMELLFPQTLEPYATIFPEIYLPANTQLLLDIMRDSGTQNDQMTFVLHGSKIFQAS